MQAGQPSRTAGGAAAYRAAHQIADRGFIFADPFARSILGEAACLEADEKAREPATRGFRWLMAARSRYAEDRLAAAVAEGVRQVVVLGAGLDTFALRNPFQHLSVRVFEVDHPATQAWKRERLQAARLAVPGWLTFVPIDFNRDTIAEALARHGLDLTWPSFIMWLGVVPYLERAVIHEVLRFIASVPGSSVVFDYSEPPERYPPDRRAALEALRLKTAASGEPLITYFDPDELANDLRVLGFDNVEDLGRKEISIRFFGAREAEAPSGAGPHFIAARRRATREARQAFL